MLRFKDETARWEISKDFEEIFHPVLQSPPEVVKSSSLKRVTRHQLSGRTFYIKRYLHQAKALRPAKFFLKASQGRVEWRLAFKLAHLNVPVVPHLAYGERWTWRGLSESILITEGPPHYGPLDGESMKSPLFQHAFGLFVRQLHDRGVLQDDFHRENLLYSKESNTFCLVDLDRIAVVKSISTQQRFLNVCLIHSFQPLTLPFHEGYGEFLERREEIQQCSLKIHRTRLPHRAKRALKENRDFQQVQNRSLKWWVRRSFLTEKLSRILANPDAMLKAKGHSLASRSSPALGRGEGMVIERFNWRDAGSFLSALFRPPPGVQNFLKAFHLELARVPTPKPIAAGVRSNAPFPSSSYLVTEEIPGRKDFAELRAKKRQLIHALANLMARLHEEGFNHPNLTLGSFVFSEDGNAYLTDLIALFFLGTVSDCLAVQNLAHLGASAAEIPDLSSFDNARFLIYYARIRGQRDTRWWWEQLKQSSIHPKKSRSEHSQVVGSGGRPRLP